MIAVQGQEASASPKLSMASFAQQPLWWLVSVISLQKLKSLFGKGVSVRECLHRAGLWGILLIGLTWMWGAPFHAPGLKRRRQAIQWSASWLRAPFDQLCHCDLPEMMACDPELWANLSPFSPKLLWLGYFIRELEYFRGHKERDHHCN